jgi:ABC-type Mn2+/Zn2+ transport system permease subunit
MRLGVKRLVLPPATGSLAMTQLRTVSMVFAIIASVVALVAGFILFFVFEPPFLASIFLASASIAIGCFILTGIAAYFSDA